MPYRKYWIFLAFSLELGYEKLWNVPAFQSAGISQRKMPASYREKMYARGLARMGK